MIVVNLYGGPGAGKSTLSAYTFAKLKVAGVNCELITEYAKDKVWENNKTALDNQIYVYAKQYFSIERCRGKVDVVITDSPLLLSAYYNKDSEITETFNALMQQIDKKYVNLNYYVCRKKPYNSVGRLQTETEAISCDFAIRELMKKFSVDHKEIDGELSSSDIILQDVLNCLERQKNGTVGN